MGDKLAREIWASKNVEYSNESGWGVKTLFERIACVYFAKLKDEEQRRIGAKKRCDILQFFAFMKSLLDFLFLKYYSRDELRKGVAIV